MSDQVLESRIWIDGCFDFAHHGHAGAMLQARRLGKELYVGVHTDEDILANKGPVVMKLDERIKAVEACKWCTKSVPGAPYNTDPEVMDENKCKYVVHGDDITTNASGEDCYKTVKDLGRFIVVKRTPNISTTDLVGRMLLFTKTHHIKTITEEDVAVYKANKGNESYEFKNDLFNHQSVEKFKQYATYQDGVSPGSLVYVNTDKDQLYELIAPSSETASKIKERGIIYIDGGFDLFNPGHIDALRAIHEDKDNTGISIIVGVNDDHSVNLNKGLNYPIMSIFERSLCVLQCRYVDGIILGAPHIPSTEWLNSLPGKVISVYHGPTNELVVDPQSNEKVDPYAESKKLGLYKNIGPHEYDHITTEDIVSRVLDNKKQYEERQRRKGWKSEIEKRLEEEEKTHV